jgi:FAD/FMN-containing dehydrogenase
VRAAELAGEHTAHQGRVAALLADYEALPPGSRVRLAKRTSNLFRDRQRTGAKGLDVSGFTHVLEVDPLARTAVVEGMVTYQALVDATLPYGLMPLVVPQLRTITLGGAVSGLGIESSSFRNGMPHESVLAMEILTGDGRVVTATPDGEHADLFHGFPNSYGTLGYALALTIELEPVKPYVKLRHRRFDDPDEYFAALADTCNQKTDRKTHEQVDFVDGVVFSGTEMYLTTGTFTETAPYTSDYTGMDIYYRSVQRRSVDFLTVHDYLWRWDTDWFWCSRALGVQNPAVRRLVPKRFLHSEYYWKAIAFERRHGWMAALDRRRGRPEQEEVVQDVEVLVGRAAEYLDFMLRDIPIEPIWVCPVRQRRDGSTWTLYDFGSTELFVNFGFWSTVPLRPGQPDGTHNRLVEAEVARLGGHKSLYSTAWYDEDEFWRLYHGDAYAVLKKTYDGERRLLDLYQKCVRNG